MIDKSTTIIQFYNKMTFIANEFDLENYLRSFDHLRDGLILAFLLRKLVLLGFTFNIEKGFSHQEESHDKFKKVKISLIQVPKNLEEQDQKKIKSFTLDELKEGSSIYFCVK